MLRDMKIMALLPLLALGACAVAVPTQPTVTAMPGHGRSWDQFLADNATCKSYAATQMPGAQQATAQTHDQTATTAVAGTALGAGLGAALGSLSGNVGIGAALGAGFGLLGGAAVANGDTQTASESLQGRYDIAYAQCMVGHGETIEQPVAQPVYVEPPVIYTPPPVFFPPAPYYYPPPY